MGYQHTLDSRVWHFDDLKTLLAKASPYRSGDVLAGVAAESPVERTAARMALAELPLVRFLEEPVIPGEDDEVTRLILESHDARAFAAVAHLTVGDFRDWLLGEAADEATLTAIRPGLTPEMAAAVCKLMRNQDLISVARRCRVVTRFRNTIGLPGTLAMRLQPNHPADDPRGILAGVLDGLMYGCGDAVIGVNPVSDDMTNPFAAITFFDADREMTLDSGMTQAQFTETLDAALPSENMFYAVKISGVFSYMKTRSVPGQQKPYPPLVEVTAHQPEFEMHDVSGTIVGFRCPPYVAGVNVVGYHLHFISDDLSSGGHILDFTVAEATAQVDDTGGFFMILPGESSDFYKSDFGQDRSGELEEAEK